jgi:hypothetical protein
LKKLTAQKSIETTSHFRKMAKAIIDTEFITIKLAKKT